MRKAEDMGHINDTSPEAFRQSTEALRRMSRPQRLQMAFEFSDWLRTVTEAGVRRRHPDYDEEQVRRAVMRLWLGEEHFPKVFPNETISP